MRSAPDGQENILKHLLGHGVITRDAQGDRKHQGAELLVQLGKGRLVAVHDAGDGPLRRGLPWSFTAAALRLRADDVDQLLRAGGHPPLAALAAAQSDPEDRALLAAWAVAATSVPEPVVHPLAALPSQLTPLVGREREVAEVAALLCRPEVRLLTLSGPGGIGKTRLAVAAAAAAQRRFADGAVFVSLEPIADAALLAPTIAKSLALGEGGGQPLRERLHAFLRERELLLVLDNCEQIAELAGPVVELLAAAPRLTLLCTSRALLRLTGEWEFAVPPLGVPAAADEQDPAAYAWPSPPSGFTPRTPPRLRRSAGAWTVCPSPSSSPRPAPGFSRRRLCSPASSTASAC